MEAAGTGISAVAADAMDPIDGSAGIVDAPVT